MTREVFKELPITLWWVRAFRGIAGRSIVGAPSVYCPWLNLAWTFNRRIRQKAMGVASGASANCDGRSDDNLPGTVVRPVPEQRYVPGILLRGIPCCLSVLGTLVVCAARTFPA